MHLFTRTVRCSTQVTPDTIAVADRSQRTRFGGRRHRDRPLGGRVRGTIRSDGLRNGPSRPSLAGVAEMNNQLLADVDLPRQGHTTHSEHMAGPAESSLMNPFYGEVRSDGVTADRRRCDRDHGRLPDATTYDPPSLRSATATLAQLAESVTGHARDLRGRCRPGPSREFGWLRTSRPIAAARRCSRNEDPSGERRLRARRCSGRNRPLRIGRGASNRLRHSSRVGGEFPGAWRAPSGRRGHSAASASASLSAGCTSRLSYDGR